MQRKESDVFPDEDSKAFAAHAVKGCPYMFERLIECLRILFLAGAFLAYPRRTNDNLKASTIDEPLDCFPPPGEQVQGIFAAITGQCGKLIKNMTLFFLVRCTIASCCFSDDPMSFFHTEPHILPPDHMLECNLG